MGLITQAMSFLFGGGASSAAQVAGIFRENAEAAAIREAAGKAAALNQFAAEFTHPRRGLFDRFIDGLNRLPRPMLALGTLGLFVAAMAEPEWFASRMSGIALIPEPLWWLMGAIVSFYFGARHQVKSQGYEASLARSIALAPQVVEGIETLRRLETNGPKPPVAAAGERAETSDIHPNAALDEWRAARGR